MTHNQVSIELLYSTFPLTAIMLSRISPSHGSPKFIFTRLEEKDQNNI